MYQGTADFLTANERSFQKHRVRGTIDNISFTGLNILGGSMTISNQCSDAQDSKVGAVFVGKLTVTFLKNLSVTPTSWKGRKITVIFGLCIDEVNDTYEEFNLGQYYVSEANITADGVSVVAYDAMAFFDKNLPTDFLVSGYLYDVSRALCATCGVTFGMTEQQCQALPNGTQPLGSYTPNDCVTYRDLIYWLSQTVGGFATIDRSGSLVFRTYQGRGEEDEVIEAARRVQGASFSDFHTDFSSAVFENYDGTSQVIGAAGTGSTYYIGMNPFLQFGTEEARTQMRTAVYNAVRTLQYTPFRVELISAPIYELGDVIGCTGGIIDGTDKTGIVQAFTWQMNKGVTIQGFGQNPALQNVQSASEKANSAARKSEQNSEVVYRDYLNGVPIVVSSDPVKVVDIYFTTNKLTDVEMWHEIQLQTELASGSSSMTVEAVYTMDHVELARRPVETFEDDAYHLLDLHYFMGLDEVGSHRWEVYLIASGGTANIRANDALAVLKGQGISKADGWTGVIILEDEVQRPDLFMPVGEFSDSVNVSLLDGEIISISDQVERPFMVMYPGSFSDTIDITMNHIRFNLCTEDGSALCTEDGGSNIVTE